MRLQYLLNNLDWLSNVVIWDDSGDDDPIFKGLACDVPWTLMDMVIYKGLDHGECGVSVRSDEDGSPILVISVKDQEE